MATNLETVQWGTVLQFETNDVIQGGLGGIDNLPHIQLGNRDSFLKARQDALAIQGGLSTSDSDTQQVIACAVIHVPAVSSIAALPVPQVSSPRSVVVVTRNVSGSDGLTRAYSWSSSSAAANDGLNVITPAGNPANGRWLLMRPDTAIVDAALFGGQNSAFYRNASNLNAGSVPSPQLGSGTADATTYLRGDRQWSTVNAVTLAGQLLAFFQNAGNLNAGVAAPARLGNGSPSASNWLRGDGVWSAVDSATLGGQAAGFYQNASNLTAGIVPTARLGSGTANGSTYLRGDNVWSPVNASTLQGNTPSQFFDAGNLNAGLINPARVPVGAVTQWAGSIKGQNLSGRAGTSFTIQAGSGPPNLAGSQNGDLFGFF